MLPLAALSFSLHCAGASYTKRQIGAHVVDSSNTDYTQYPEYAIVRQSSADTGVNQRVAASAACAILALGMQCAILALRFYVYRAFCLCIRGHESTNLTLYKFYVSLSRVKRINLGGRVFVHSPLSWHNAASDLRLAEPKAVFASALSFLSCWMAALSSASSSS